MDPSTFGKEKCPHKSRSYPCPTWISVYCQGLLRLIQNMLHNTNPSIPSMWSYLFFYFYFSVRHPKVVNAPTLDVVLILNHWLLAKLLSLTIDIEDGSRVKGVYTHMHTWLRKRQLTIRVWININKEGIKEIKPYIIIRNLNLIRH